MIKSTLYCKYTRRDTCATPVTSIKSLEAHTSSTEVTLIKTLNIYIASTTTQKSKL